MTNITSSIRKGSYSVAYTNVRNVLSRKLFYEIDDQIWLPLMRGVKNTVANGIIGGIGVRNE